MARVFKSIAKIKREIPEVATKFINNASGDFENAELKNQSNNPQTKKGRPKTSEERTSMTLYLTKLQYEKITSIANELGMPKNSYIIYMLFKKEELFSNEDLNKLLIRAKENGMGLKDYLKKALNLNN